MRPEDFSIFRTVQSILVRNYVDTQKLEVDVINGVVYVQGELVLFNTASGRKMDDLVERDAIIKRTLMQTEREIRRLTSASAICFKFTNWEQVGARWVRRHGTSSRAA
jgi:hypothetical protein